MRVVPHGDVAALEAALARGGARAPAACSSRSTASTAWTATSRRSPSSSPRRAATARIVLLDDAHGIGALGARGPRQRRSSSASRAGVDVLLGTLGKALGSFGAFVAGSAALRELLVNTARSFIFSCALAPPQVEAARAALARRCAREPWRRERLAANAARLRARLARHGLSTAPSTTHIVPVVIGDNARTMAACEALLERGFYAQGIRHPSVPAGTRAPARSRRWRPTRAEEIDALGRRGGAQAARAGR